MGTQWNPYHLSCLEPEEMFISLNLVFSLDAFRLVNGLHFITDPVKIIDHKVKQLKQSRISIVKVRWNSRQGAEYTWEREDQFRKKYPHLFTKPVP
ncbi:hypothetical protein Tco_1333459 [Tanacetum coccineum]